MSNAPEASDVKWHTMITRFCPVCNSKKKHNKGTKYAGKKEITVVECLGCNEETEIER